jgi:cleavage and polyadenylation specificity factor subunit 3
MGRLRAALQSQYAESDIKVHTPRNCEPLELTFNAERVVKVSLWPFAVDGAAELRLLSVHPRPRQVIGKLAAEPPKTGSTLSGLLIQKDFSYTMLDPQDLKDFTGLGTSDIVQRQSISISVSWEVIRWHLEGMYGEVDEQEEDGLPVFRVGVVYALLIC